MTVRHLNRLPYLPHYSPSVFLEWHDLQRAARFARASAPPWHSGTNVVGRNDQRLQKRRRAESNHGGGICRTVPAERLFVCPPDTARDVQLRMSH